MLSVFQFVPKWYNELMKKYNEVRARNGKADDIVIDGVNIHLEDMDGRNWWLGVYRGEKRATFWISSKSKITVRVEENELGLKSIEQNDSHIS